MAIVDDIKLKVSFCIDQLPGSMDTCPHCGEPMIGGEVAIRGDLWSESKQEWQEGWIDPITISCLSCAGDEYLMELPKYVV
jgi:hypothetical protein